MIKQQNFKSIHEFYNYITTRETNQIFAHRSLESKEGTYSFTETHSFEGASGLLLNGWESKAKEIEKALYVRVKSMAAAPKQKSEYSVVGGQASVARYLQGIPTNMINRKSVPQKQKVITLTKSVSYSASVAAETIFENSLAALQMIKAIEDSGTRVNLNIVLGTQVSREKAQIKIRIKSAGERMNVSKLAFPLVHPSMLRRLMFKYLEVTDLITSREFAFGYGSPIEDADVVLEKGELLIPKYFKESEIAAYIKNNLK